MLYMDIGNSFIKLAEPDGENWRVLLRTRHDDRHELMEFLNHPAYADHQIVACSVVTKMREVLQDQLGRRIKFITVADLPERDISYETPHTLGIDRVMACYGARALSPEVAVIVVDAGTAVTIDFMDEQGVFRGGVIMPGIGMLEQGLRSYAPELPEVPREVPPVWPPQSTRQALQWGITGSWLQSVLAYVEHFTAISEDASVWITGGDADVLTQIRDLPLQYHPNLVFEGLRVRGADLA